MKRYVIALCALAICALFAGSAETASLPITTTLTSAEMTTMSTHPLPVTDDIEEERVIRHGWSLDDYKNDGIILVPVYSRSGDDEPVFYYMSNVLDLYFIYASTNEEREGFISAHSDIFEEKLGGLKSYRMKQVKLKEPLTDKASLTIEEYYDEICKKAETFAEISPIVFHANTEEYYTNLRLN